MALDRDPIPLWHSFQSVFKGKLALTSFDFQIQQFKTLSFLYMSLALLESHPCISNLLFTIIYVFFCDLDIFFSLFLHLILG